MSCLPGPPTDSSPQRLSASVALLALLGACFVGSIGPIQRAPFLLVAAGVALVAGGVVLRQLSRHAGSTLVGLGFVVAAAALVGAVALSPPVGTLLALLSSGVGVVLVTLGVFPLYARFVRSFVVLGITFVMAGVVANALVGDPPLWRSAVAVTLVFLSWDTSERAIRLGEEVGVTAETTAVEVAGITASAVVGVLAIGFTIALSHVPAGSPSIVGLALLLVSLVSFTLAFSHVPHVPEP